MLTKLKSKIQAWNAARELRRYAPLLAKESENLKAKELVNILYSPNWERFFWIKQVKKEIEGLVEAVAALQPKIIVEIGTNMGGSLFCFTKVAQPNALIISIDLPEGLGGGGYPLYRSNFYQSFASQKQKMLLWRLDSHKEHTLTQLKKILNGQKIDFLFLDGDHSYEGIKQDFEWYAPLVKSGGIIAFHDIKPSLPDNWIQVGRFWNEIKKEYQHKEIVSDEVSWGGIGILYQN
jgi:predicted O-methyltransferase YrrM